MSENKRSNISLQKAKNAKDDEYYTQLSDIENELSHYKEHFRGKTVFCNCDDPFESNFFKYFAMKFNFLGLQKLIVTGYSTSKIAFTQLPLFEIPGMENEKNKAYKIEINEVYDANGDGAEDLADVKYLLKTGKGKNKLTLLNGDGDFRSEESIKLLEQSDIVCTNPPFSLLKDYISQLVQYKKQFLIIGTENAITYKEVFPLIKGNKIWTGFNHVKEFIKPDGTTKKFGNVGRYTNLDTKRRHEKMILFKKYTPDEYPKYETFNGIDVASVSDIPYDFDGVMGVPKTFMNSYNPEQFEILGYEREDENIKVGIKNMPESFLEDYRRHGGKGHYTSGMKMLCFYKEGQPKIPFSRILIRKK